MFSSLPTLSRTGKGDAVRWLRDDWVSERAALSVTTFVWKYRTLMGGCRIAHQRTRGLEA